MRKLKTKPQMPDSQIRTRIIAEALRLAALEPWENVAPLDIANGCNITYAQLTQFFPTKAGIVAVIVQGLDDNLEQSGLDWDENTPMCDRLFDTVMERLDLMTPHRAAHISFLKSFGWVKNDRCGDVQMLRGTVSRIAQVAGMETSGLADEARRVGLSVIYGWTLLAWMYDTSPDLSKTMVRLDRALGQAAKVARYMGV